MWAAYEQILHPEEGEEEDEATLLYVRLPKDCPHVTWLLDASDWLHSQAPYACKTLHEIQYELVNHTATLHAQLAPTRATTGSIVLAFNLVALLPLHFPLPQQLTPEDVAILGDLVRALHEGHLLMPDAMNTVSARAVEACPLLHWQWLKCASERLQCPPTMTKLEIVRGLAMHGKFDTPTKYAALRTQFLTTWVNVPTSPRRAVLEAMGVTPAFQTCLADHLLAQQFVANPGFCRSIVIPPPSLVSVMPPPPSVAFTGKSLSVVEIHHEFPGAESFAQLTNRVLATFAGAAAECAVLVTTRPDALALLVIALAGKYSSLPALPLLPLQRVLLRRDALLIDLGAFFNRLLRLHGGATSQDLVQWALAALLSKEDRALSRAFTQIALFPRFAAKTLFSGVGIANVAHLAVQRWYLGAWAQRLAPDENPPPDHLSIPHLAAAMDIPLPPALHHLSALVGTVYFDAVERLYTHPQTFKNLLVDVYTENARDYCYTVQAEEPPAFAAILSASGPALKRCYIVVVPTTPASPILGCWTCTPIVTTL